MINLKFLMISVGFIIIAILVWFWVNKTGEKSMTISPAPSSPSFHAVKMETISNPTRPIIDKNTDLKAAAASLSPASDSSDFEKLNQQIDQL